MKLVTLATKNLIWVAPSDRVDKAICLMEEHGFHHLPVIENGRVIGMLSDRDLLIAVGWKLEVERAVDGDPDSVIGPLQVREIMSSPAISLSPDTDVHSAARIMVNGKLHAFAIVKNDKPIGIVTSYDILKKVTGRSGPRTPAWLRRPVGRIMTTRLITIGPREPLHAAARMLRENRVRHLPVTVDGALLGMITDRDIRRTCGQGAIEDALAEERGAFYLGSTQVIEVMSHEVVTATEGMTLLDACWRMVDRRIGSLPVCRGEIMVGMLTDSDLLRCIADADDMGI
jgi:CBS domain-containing protein